MCRDADLDDRPHGGRPISDAPLSSRFPEAGRPQAPSVSIRSSPYRLQVSGSCQRSRLRPLRSYANSCSRPRSPQGASAIGGVSPNTPISRSLNSSRRRSVPSRPGCMAPHCIPPARHEAPRFVTGPFAGKRDRAQRGRLRRAWPIHPALQRVSRFLAQHERHRPAAQSHFDGVPQTGLDGQHHCVAIQYPLLQRVSA